MGVFVKFVNNIQLMFLCVVWCRAGAVVAKYGDKSVYFDLEDLGNTTGQWDLYGSDAPSPYNPLQVLPAALNLFININIIFHPPS